MMAAEEEGIETHWLLAHTLLVPLGNILCQPEIYHLHLYIKEIQLEEIAEEFWGGGLEERMSYS